MKYLDPDGRACFSYKTYYDSNFKYSYKHYVTSITENIDIESIDFYNRDAAMGYYEVTCNNNLKKICEGWNFSETAINTIMTIAQVGNIPIEVDPNLSAAIWGAGLLLNYFANVSEKESSNLVKCIGQFYSSLRNVTGLNVASKEDSAKLNSYIKSMTVTESFDEKFKMNLDTDFTYRKKSETVKRIFTFQAEVYNPRTKEYETITSSTEDFE